MSITTKTQKMLWGRSASRCSICKLELVMDASETDDESLVGENCHIVAKETNGPRGKSELTPDQRDKYNNLILLCNVHHKQIDDQPGSYTVEALHSKKNEHEQWVRQQLSIYDSSKQRDEEIYAGYVDEWEKKLSIDNWKDEISRALSHGQPSLSKELDNKILEASDWLLGRVWPNRYRDLEAAFNNFRIVLQDFYNVFHEHAVNQGEYWETEKYYRIDEWNEERYRKLADDFHYHVALVEDLSLELTRAANYLCDKIRSTLMHSYRIKEGVLLIQSGPHMDLSYKTYRAEYKNGERVDLPYPGLEEFKVKRTNRDFHFGKNDKV